MEPALRAMLVPKRCKQEQTVPQFKGFEFCRNLNYDGLSGWTFRWVRPKSFDDVVYVEDGNMFEEWLTMTGYWNKLQTQTTDANSNLNCFVHIPLWQASVQESNVGHIALQATTAGPKQLSMSRYDQNFVFFTLPLGGLRLWTRNLNKTQKSFEVRVYIINSWR